MYRASGFFMQFCYSIQYSMYRIIILSIYLLTTSIAHAQLSESYTDKAAGFNGSFEFVKNGIPANWQVYTPKTTRDARFALTVDTQYAADGKRCLKWMVEQCSPDGGWFSPGISKEFACMPGAIYSVSFKIKNTGAKVRFKTDAVSAKQKYKGQEYTAAESLSEWKTITQRITVPQSFNRLRIEFNILGSGTVWLDDVAIKQLKK